MTSNEFLQKRNSVVPPVEVIDDEKDLTTDKSYRSVLTPSGSLVQIEVDTPKDDVDVPYTMYDNEFMIKHAIGDLGSMPLSNFAVYDKLCEIKNNFNNIKKD